MVYLSSRPASYISIVADLFEMYEESFAEHLIESLGIR